MSPGSQFQVKTNLDKQAIKIEYQLKFFNEEKSDEKTFSVKPSNSKYCSNNSIIISQDGTIYVAWLEQHELKHFQQCTATLLVNLLCVNDQSSLKQQTLAFTIKVKPIVYSMIKLVKGSLVRASEFTLNKIPIDRKSLLRNKLVLNDAGIKMKWHVSYHDNLGDVFDVIRLTNKYRLNRNDLIDVSQLNNNLFSTFVDQDQRQSSQRDHQSGSKSSKPNDLASSHISLMADSVENSFVMKTVKKGRFVMELTPYASNLDQSKDFLGLVIEAENAVFENDGFKLRLQPGDLICLERQDLSGSQSKLTKDYLNNAY